VDAMREVSNTTIDKPTYSLTEHRPAQHQRTATYVTTGKPRLRSRGEDTAEIASSTRNTPKSS